MKLKAETISLPFMVEYKLLILLNMLKEEFNPSFVYKALLEYKKSFITKEILSLKDILAKHDKKPAYITKKFDIKYATLFRYLTDKEDQARSINVETYDEIAAALGEKTILLTKEYRNNIVRKIVLKYTEDEKNRQTELLKEIQQYAQTKRINYFFKDIIVDSLLFMLIENKDRFKNNPDFANKKLVFLLSQAKKQYIGYQKEK